MFIQCFFILFIEWFC